MTLEFIEKILTITCEEYGITCDELLDKSRKWDRAIPRKVVCHILTIQGLTVKEVGKILIDTILQ
jgi:chromosomal replication initiation ATPase DnaA